MVPGNNQICDECGLVRPRVVLLPVNYDESHLALCLVCVERAAQIITGEEQPTEEDLARAAQVRA